jgi:hypothetical protein
MCRNFVPFGTGHGTFLQGQVLWIGLAKGQVKSEACSTDLLMITSGNYLDGQFAIAQRRPGCGYRQRFDFLEMSCGRRTFDLSPLFEPQSHSYSTRARFVILCCCLAGRELSRSKLQQVSGKALTGRHSLLGSLPPAPVLFFQGLLLIRLLAHPHILGFAWRNRTPELFPKKCLLLPKNR